MKIQLLFPIILIILDFLAAGVYFLLGDWKRGGYWLSAGLISTFVILI